MLDSLLHRTVNFLFATTGLVLLINSAQVVADGQSFVDSSLSSNTRTMSSDDLLNSSEYTLDASEKSQQLMNAMWLESGIRENENNAEGNDALRTLAKNALKTYWKAWVRKEPAYNRYTPIVQGNFSIEKGGADYDLRLSGNSIEFGIEYTF